MSTGSRHYLKSAFNARPLGMFVAPNWILLGVFTLLGLLNWGFWVLGAGVELAYLFLLVNNARFRQHVDSQEAARLQAPTRERIEAKLARLGREDRARYEELRGRCERLLRDPHGDAAAMAVQRGALDRLLWMYVQLLRSRGALESLLREAASRGEDEEALLRQAQGLGVQQASADKQLGRSLAAQEELLRQRAARQVEARSKLTQIEAELRRIEHQVELIREEAVISADPSAMSLRIDAVSTGLNETMSWLRAQPELDAMELLDEAPELLEASSDARTAGRR
ncbi:hypothetical protein [Chondromyces crocatus]|uniref:Uncharacterized protein n=1 Tax=Chondromyces crocatus TaxID=52 RepID=A0A0K1E8K1_CHOCO|nr:hypothetical protein [Chondromyces crocatus]AKT37179.1 uncharacterized protein CMC5_013090 [Chondromyces crocatus]